MVHGAARAGFALLPAETPPQRRAAEERRRTWGWSSYWHLSSDLIGSMSSPNPFLSKKTIGPEERGRAQRSEWHSARHWGAYLEPGELRLREKDHANVTVTSTCVRTE